MERAERMELIILEEGGWKGLTESSRNRLPTPSRLYRRV